MRKKKNQQTLRLVDIMYATLRTKRKIEGRQMNGTSEKGEKTLSAPTYT